MIRLMVLLVGFNTYALDIHSEIDVVIRCIESECEITQYETIDVKEIEELVK